jgi:prepilin-type processing-associated H-X9-DG protein
MSTAPEPPPAPANSKRRFSRVAVLLTLAAVGGCAVALSAGVQQAREAGRISTCHCRLTQIGLAMQNYESKYGAFPPAYQLLDGQPSSSWRLELIPNMSLQAEYDRYHHNERWDSDFNLRLADEVAAKRPMYRCPSAPASQGPALANYVMLVGPNSFSPGASGVKRTAIVDGTSNTIAVAEIANTDIYWTEPRDLTVSGMSYQLNAPRRSSISSGHPGRATVLFADGHTTTLSDSIDPDVLKALTTINGDEGRLHKLD